jgi:hypothetical protein
MPLDGARIYLTWENVISLVSDAVEGVPRLSTSRSLLPQQPIALIVYSADIENLFL